MNSKLWSGLGGLAFAAGVIGVFAVLGDGPPESKSGAKEYFDDLQVGLGYGLGVLTAVGLAAFAAAIHRVTGSVIAVAALVAGGAMILLTLGTLLGLAETANEYKSFSYDTSLTELVDTTAYFLVTSAHAMIAIGALAAGLAMRTTASVPAWLTWFTIVVGVVGLASPAFFPMMLIWLWAAVTGIVLALRGPASADSTVTT